MTAATQQTTDEAVAQLRQQLGAPILVPTDLQLHRACAKRQRSSPVHPMHGVTFCRLDDDAVAYAQNGTIAVRVVWPGEAANVPDLGAVLPAKAWKVMAAAKEDTAALWIVGSRCRVVVDGDVHEFRLLDALALDAEGSFQPRDKASLRLSDVAVEAAMLLRLQKAMGALSVELRQLARRRLLVLPQDIEHGLDVAGAISLLPPGEGS